ncbi:flagellar export protein FliJ [Treponema berlinense]|uniref:flagellar export protein FliJ n=1 Tax=Treponema berlinense TaxID=225004 RepID=UPI0015C01494|nr:flagellar export protein FliJ [Treponema berlinense]
MQKFVFNMQKILNLRKFEEKQAQAELGKAVSAETRIQDTLNLIARQNVQTVQNASGIKNPLELYNLNNYLRLLSQRKEKLLQELAQAHIETEQKREKMREAMLKVKALEKLKEVRQNEWAQENKRREEKELDDIANSKQLRQG